MNSLRVMSLIAISTICIKHSTQIKIGRDESGGRIENQTYIWV